MTGYKTSAAIARGQQRMNSRHHNKKLIICRSPLADNAVRLADVPKNRPFHPLVPFFDYSRDMAVPASTRPSLFGSD